MRLHHWKEDSGICNYTGAVYHMILFQFCLQFYWVLATRFRILDDRNLNVLIGDPPRPKCSVSDAAEAVCQRWVKSGVWAVPASKKLASLAELCANRPHLELRALAKSCVKCQHFESANSKIGLWILESCVARNLIKQPWTHWLAGIERRRAEQKQLYLE